MPENPGYSLRHQTDPSRHSDCTINTPLPPFECPKFGHRAARIRHLLSWSEAGDVCGLSRGGFRQDGRT